MTTVGLGLCGAGCLVIYLTSFSAIDDKAAFRVWCAGAALVVSGIAILWTVHP